MEKWILFWFMFNMDGDCMVTDSAVYGYETFPSQSVCESAEEAWLEHFEELAAEDPTLRHDTDCLNVSPL